VRFRSWLVLPLAAAAAIAAIPAGAASGSTTFGPRQFTRSRGPTQTFTESFPRCASGACRLVVVNGGADGSNRVSSASIYLNGRRVLGPSDFNQRVERIVLPVPLESSDELRVVLNSAPGSYLTVSVECDTFPALGIDSAGVTSSIWSNGTVSLAIPLGNGGNVTVSDVSITGMTAGGGVYAGPTPFAYEAGEIGPDERVNLSALFSGVDGHAAFPLTVQGTYAYEGATCSFEAQTTVNPPPPGNGGTPKFTTTVPRFTAETAVYPAAPLGHDPEDETNEGGDYVPPLGEPRNLPPIAPSATSLDRGLALHPVDQAPPGGSPSDVVFLRNKAGNPYNGAPPDPSVAGATPGGFTMISGNTAVGYSTDFGQTFTTVNLTKSTGFNDPANPGRPDFFPESDGGVCCDQVLQYIPSRDLMVWLLQYWSPGINVGGLPQKGQNRLRIAWATPAAAAADFLHAWSWFDVTPTTLGDTTATDWMDYPDLAFSDGWLYISVDHGFWNAGKDTAGNVIGQQVYKANRWFVRASLNDMASLASSINLIYYEPNKNGLYKAHFAQSAPDTMYYAARPDTSTLSVFADPDSATDVPTPKDIPVAQSCKDSSVDTCDFKVTDPDGVDWNWAPHGVLGATYVQPGTFCPPGGCSGPTRFLYFAYDGGRNKDKGREYPYVRVEKIDADALTLVSELDIWNPGFAFATPGLFWRPGSLMDEVAVSLAVGGGGSYPDNGVGFLGDFVVYMTTSSNVTQDTGVAARPARYGDYFNVRNAFAPPVPGVGQGVGYSTTGYAVTRPNNTVICSVGGCSVDLHYVLFGRSADLFPSPPPVIK